MLPLITIYVFAHVVAITSCSGVILVYTVEHQALRQNIEH